MFVAKTTRVYMASVLGSAKCFRHMVSGVMPCLLNQVYASTSEICCYKHTTAGCDPVSCRNTHVRAESLSLPPSSPHRHNAEYILMHSAVAKFLPAGKGELLEFAPDDALCLYVKLGRAALGRSLEPHYPDLFLSFWVVSWESSRKPYYLSNSAFRQFPSLALKTMKWSGSSLELKLISSFLEALDMKLCNLLEKEDIRELNTINWQSMFRTAVSLKVAFPDVLQPALFEHMERLVRSCGV